MTWWVAGTAIVGSSLIGANAAQSAASTQSDAARYAADLQNQQWQQQQANMADWLKAGKGAVNRLSTGLASGGEFATPFSQTNWQQDPGYQFRLSEGLKAIDRSMAAKGLGVSGAALKAAGRYGQEAASQEYQNAFNRYYNERNQMLSPLQSLAGVGQNTATTLGQQGSTAASNIGNYLTSGAAAQAAGTVGASNAITGGVGTYLNYSNQQNLLNALGANRTGGYLSNYTPSYAGTGSQGWTSGYDLLG